MLHCWRIFSPSNCFGLVVGHLTAVLSSSTYCGDVFSCPSGSGALRITPRLPLQIHTYFEEDLTRSLEIYRESGSEINTTLKEDFDAVQHLVNWVLNCGVSVILVDLTLKVCTSTKCSLLQLKSFGVAERGLF